MSGIAGKRIPVFFVLLSLVFAISCGGGGTAAPSASSPVVVPPDAPTVSGITNGLFKTNQTFTVSGESGAVLKYSINGGDTWNTYVAGVILSDEGVYSVVATQSVNGVVSAYSPAIALQIDKTLPDPPAVSGITAGTYKTSQSFSAEGDPGASLEYSINGGDFWQIYSGQVYITDEGSYSVTARQTDAAGNVSAISAPVAVIIDKSALPPVVTGIASGYYNSSQTFTLAGENGALIEYSLDGGDTWNTYTDPVSFGDEGVYQITVRQTDPLDNSSSISAIIEVIIILTQPDPPVVAGISAGLYNTPQAFTMSGDEGAEFECSLDGGTTWNPCEGEQTLSDNGNYNVTARQIDRAGNVSSQSTPVQFSIDAAAPAEAGFVTATPSIGQVVLNWTDPADEDYTKVLVSFTPDAPGVPQPIEVLKGAASVAVNPLINGTEYTFTIKTVDALGNISAGTTISSMPNDITLPVAGNTGILTVSDVRPRSFWISWTKGSDNITPQDELQYEIVRSLSDNISSVADAELNGVVVKNWTDILYWTGDQTSWQITGLSFNTSYYYNVLVRDKAGNKASYAMGSQATLTVPELTDVNGTVSALALDGDTLYIGGAFTAVYGPGYGAILDMVSGILKDGTDAPKINGEVSVIISDGTGGWYIGGTFTSVNNMTRNRIARINSDGSLHAWNPNSNGTVLSFAKKGNRLFVGGSFTQIGGQTRNRIAAIDIRSGLASDWYPASGANGNVTTIAAGDGVIYAGGAFTQIQTKPRNYIACLDETTGLATSWNPAANAAVNSIVINGDLVYAGGAFTSIGGQPRNYIAAIDTAAGSTLWNPSANGEVNNLLLADGVLFVCGNFTMISSVTRNRNAAYNATTGVITAWAPSADGRVRSIAVSGDTVYTAGEFANFAGQARARLAAVDKTSGLIKPWNPGAAAIANSVAADTDSVFTGGAFSNVCNTPRNRIAAIDVRTGKVKPWNPDVNEAVSAIAVSGTKVYFGGAFTAVSGQTRNRIAAVDSDTGSLIAWNPNANAAVSSITINGDMVYSGGAFTNICGYTRNRIAAINKETGTLDAWNPNVTGTSGVFGLVSSVNVLAFSNNILYIGGGFSNIGISSRRSFGAIDMAADPTIFNPVFSYMWEFMGSTADVATISSLYVSGDLIYVGGIFASVGGILKYNLAAINTITGAITTWNPAVAAPDPFAGVAVKSISVSNGVVYFGGLFATAGGTARSNIAAVNTSTGALITGWNPGITDAGSLIGVNILLIEGDTVYTGGAFTTAGGKPKKNLAAIDKNTGVVW